MYTPTCSNHWQLQLEPAIKTLQFASKIESRSIPNKSLQNSVYKIFRDNSTRWKAIWRLLSGSLEEGLPQKNITLYVAVIIRELATRSNLQRRHITNNAQCQRCCQTVLTILRALNISNVTLNDPYTTLDKKIDACLLCCPSSSLRYLQDLPLWILWRLWKSQNILIFQRKMTPWRYLLQQARDDAKERYENAFVMETHSCSVSST